MKGRTPLGPVEMALWFGSFVQVSGEASPLASPEQIDTSLYLADALPAGLLVWVEEALCDEIQSTLNEVWIEKTIANIDLRLGHGQPCFIGFAKPIDLPCGWPLNAIAAADGRLGFDGLRAEALDKPVGEGEGQSYIEYWHWLRGRPLTEAMEENPPPTPAAIQMAITALITETVIASADQEGWPADATKKMWRRYMEIAPAMRVPGMGYVRCFPRRFDAIDGQTQARFN